MREQDASPRILVTAFRPFAPPGGTMRSANRSQEVLEALLAQSPGACDSLLLPVDPRCEVSLARSSTATRTGSSPSARRRSPAPGTRTSRRSRTTSR